MSTWYFLVECTIMLRQQQKNWVIFSNEKCSKNGASRQFVRKIVFLSKCCNIICIIGKSGYSSYSSLVNKNVSIKNTPKISSLTFFYKTMDKWTKANILKFSFLPYLILLYNLPLFLISPQHVRCLVDFLIIENI